MYVARRLWTVAVIAVSLLVGTATVQAQQIKILPAETELVVILNVKQFLASEVVKKNPAMLDMAKGKITEQLEEKGIAGYLKKADFDLFRDLSSITFASLGGGRNPEEGFILLQGKFDADKIEAAVLEASKEAGNGAKVKLITIGKVKAFEVTPKDEKVMYVGILNNQTMIACSAKADFSAAVDRLSGSRKSGTFKSEAFESLLQTVDNKQTITIAATSKQLKKLADSVADKVPEGAAGDQAKAALAVLDQMEGFSVAVTLQKNIDLKVGVNTKDAETATKYEGLAKLFIGIAKMKVAEQAQMNEHVAPAGEIVDSLPRSRQGQQSRGHRADYLRDARKTDEARAESMNR